LDLAFKLVGASSFDQANKDTHRGSFFSNTASAIAQELEVRFVASRAFGSATSSFWAVILLKRKSHNSLSASALLSFLSVRDSKSFRKRASITSGVSASISSPGALKRFRSMTHAAWPSLGAPMTGTYGNFFWDEPWQFASVRNAASFFVHFVGVRFSCGG
jgi:hypothetical protein